MGKGFYSDGRPWPKLSETLARLRPPEPGTCQKCGTTDGVGKWIECDGDDQNTKIVILLCEPCGEKIIPPHPRLYFDICSNAPTPGAMEICRHCIHRRGVACSHPDLTLNGGSGLAITGPKGKMIHFVFRSKGGARRGRTYVNYPDEPRECAGRQETSNG